MKYLWLLELLPLGLSTQPGATARAFRSEQQVLEPILAAQPGNPWPDTYHRIVREQKFGFDIDSSQYNDHFRIVENFGAQLLPPALQGQVALVKGDADQKHSFQVLVKSRSDEQRILDCLTVEAVDKTLTLDMANDCRASKRLDLRVDIAVAIRPGSIQFGGFGTLISTNVLNISIWPQLWFETYYMVLRSLTGNIECHEVDSFTAHSMNVSTGKGDITGTWSLPNSISLYTYSGAIQIGLPPKRWGSGPTTHSNLSARSITGNIDIQMPLDDDDLSLRNTRANITTESGAIDTTLVHGASTHIATKSGRSMKATLLPYWAFAEWQGMQYNFITTECVDCDMTVNLLAPIVDYYYKIPPLYFTNSSHVAQSGNLSLSYPREWAGVAEWHGDLGVRGDDFEEIEQSPRHGIIHRRPLGSHMFIELNDAYGELVMKA